MIDFYKATKVIKKDIYNSDNKNFLMSKKD